MNEKRSCGWNLCHFHQSISVKNLLLMPLLSRAGYFSLFCAITSAAFGYMSLKICGSSAQERACKASSEQHLYRLLFQRLHTDVLTAPVSPLFSGCRFSVIYDSRLCDDFLSALVL